MRKIFSIIHYEYKMLMKRFATLGVLLIGTLIALLDNFPSISNLARLEFLTQPAYFVYRTISFDTLIVAFGLMFLLSNRFSLDKKSGVKNLIASSPVSRGQYVAGKLLAAFTYTLTVLFAFVTVNLIVYCVAVPFEINVTDCTTLLLKATIVSLIPISVFISFCSVSFPAMMDIRLFYLLAAILFVFNASYVGTAGAAPFYMITSGNLCRMIWQHPKWTPLDIGSVYANLIFLLGCGTVSWLLLLIKRKFWRSE